MRRRIRLCCPGQHLRMLRNWACENWKMSLARLRRISWACFPWTLLSGRRYLCIQNRYIQNLQILLNRQQLLWEHCLCLIWKSWGILRILISLCAIICIIVYIIKIPIGIELYSMSLIMSGAVGNLLDRFRTGKVIDFIDIFVNDWHWPAFNVADSALTVGIIVFIVANLHHGSGKGGPVLKAGDASRL